MEYLTDEEFREVIDLLNEWDAEEVEEYETDYEGESVGWHKTPFGWM